MAVVSNTTPLNYLVQIGHPDLLFQLFGQVLIPRAVVDELTVEATPDVVSPLWEHSVPLTKVRNVVSSTSRARCLGFVRRPSTSRRRCSILSSSETASASTEGNAATDCPPPPPHGRRTSRKSRLPSSLESARLGTLFPRMRL